MSVDDRAEGAGDCGCTVCSCAAAGEANTRIHHTQEEEISAFCEQPFWIPLLQCLGMDPHTVFLFVFVCVCVTMLSSSVGRQTSFASRKRLYKCSPGRGGCKRRRRGGKREIGESRQVRWCNELGLFNDSFRVIWLLNAWEMSLRALDVMNVH